MIACQHSQIWVEDDAGNHLRLSLPGLEALSSSGISECDAPQQKLVVIIEQPKYASPA